MSELWRDSYRYRELIWALALRELKVRYKRSVLGFLWALLNPVLQMTVLAVVFSRIMTSTMAHYPIFLLSTLLLFTFFSQSLSYAVDSMVVNADLIRKVAVPKLVFPVAALISNMINLLLSLTPLVVLILVFRHPVTWLWVLTPIPLLALCLLALGSSFFFATANVYYRDISHIIQIVLQVLFYVTPILYTVTFFPAKYHWLFWLNPLTFALSDFRMFVYYGQMPTVLSMVASYAVAIASVVIGFSVFRRHQDEFVFYL